jgi:hypothetical protein
VTFRPRIIQYWCDPSYILAKPYKCCTLPRICPRRANCAPAVADPARSGVRRKVRSIMDAAAASSRANFAFAANLIRPPGLAGGRSVHEMPAHMAAEVRAAMSDSESVRTAMSDSESVRTAMSDSESVRTAVDVACADDRRHMAVSAAPAAVPRVAPMAPLPRTSVDAIRIAIGRLLVGVSVDGRRIPVRWTVAP